MLFARDGDTETVQDLIKANANADAIDNAGRSAVIYAVQRIPPSEPGSHETSEAARNAADEARNSIVSLLLEAGAEADKPDDTGRTALRHLLEETPSGGFDAELVGLLVGKWCQRRLG